MIDKAVKAAKAAADQGGRKIKTLLAGDDPPTSTAVKAAVDQVSRDLTADRDELDRLRRSRQDVLVTGSETEIRAHDERVRDLETRVEAGGARQQALRRRWTELEADEAVAGMPGRFKRMVDALAAYNEAEEALQDARRELSASALHVETSWATATRKRADAVEGLPLIDEKVLQRVRDLTRYGLRLPRPKPRDPDEPRAILGPDGSFRFEGSWTAAAKQRFSNQQRRV